MKKIIYYIIIHDPKIIIYFEKIGKYIPLKNYKYLLVGNHDIDYSNENIIQCDRLLNNIEHCNNFLAYTGWWAVVKNNIGTEFDYIVFLEYDTNIINIEHLEEMETNILNSEWEMMGIVGMSTSICFLPAQHEFSKLINYDDSGKFWMVTNNIIFKRTRLESFISDPMLQKVFDYLGNEVGCGHMLERYTTLYALVNKVPYGIISPYCLEHLALDSHSTQGRHSMYTNFINTI